MDIEKIINIKFKNIINISRHINYIRKCSIELVTNIVEKYGVEFLDFKLTKFDPKSLFITNKPIENVWCKFKYDEIDFEIYFSIKAPYESFANQVNILYSDYLQSFIKENAGFMKIILEDNTFLKIYLDNNLCTSIELINYCRYSYEITKTHTIDLDNLQNYNQEVRTLVNVFMKPPQHVHIKSTNPQKF